MNDAQIDAMLQELHKTARDFDSGLGCDYGLPLMFKGQAIYLREIVRQHLAPYEALRVAAHNIEVSMTVNDEVTPPDLTALRQALAALEGAKG